jgi:hypothetical protein
MRQGLKIGEVGKEMMKSSSAFPKGLDLGLILHL